MNLYIRTFPLITVFLECYTVTMVFVMIITEINTEYYL